MISKFLFYNLTRSIYPHRFPTTINTALSPPALPSFLLRPFDFSRRPHFSLGLIHVPFDLSHTGSGG